MSDASSFLGRIASALDQAGIPYMLAGSFASSHHGAPRAEMARRMPAVVLGVPVFVATAEDTVLAKLEWAKLGESERQLRDVQTMLGAIGDSLDLACIDRWLDDLGVRDLWERLRHSRAT